MTNKAKMYHKCTELACDNFLIANMEIYFTYKKDSFKS